MTELEALAKVEAAARGVTGAWREDTDIGPPIAALSGALRDLDRIRETTAEREAKRIHFFQERRESGYVLASCGLVVTEDEIHLNRACLLCPGCQETFRGKYCPGGHPGTECSPACAGYVVWGVDFAKELGK